MLANYFDHCYLINLPKREDRKQRALEECGKIGLVPEVFPAIDGKEENLAFNNPRQIEPIAWNQGAAGLMKTTERILEDAKAKGYDTILILEDDIEFHPQIHEIFDEYEASLPKNWEILQFGCCHRQTPEKINFRIFRIKRADCLHCYAIHSKIYAVFLDEIRKMEQPLDHITMNELQPRGTSYCLYPNFAYQRPDYSDIGSKNVNYSFLR